MQAPLWNGIHRATNRVLQLKQRADRTLLLSLFEQTRQICQWKVMKHGSLEEPANTITVVGRKAVLAGA